MICAKKWKLASNVKNVFNKYEKKLLVICMPIRVDNDLPAREVLESENIFMMGEERADTQQIRPLEIVILNLMPLKQDYEIQLLRALSNTPLQVNVTCMNVSSHVSKHTSASHINKFYTTFEAVRNMYFDGLIITGAPVETMEFEEVSYWEELASIMEWSKTNVTSTFHPFVLGRLCGPLLSLWYSKDTDRKEAFRCV